MKEINEKNSIFAIYFSAKNRYDKKNESFFACLNKCADFLSIRAPIPSNKTIQLNTKLYFPILQNEG